MNPYQTPVTEHETKPAPQPGSLDTINGAMLLANIVMMVVLIKTFLAL